MMHFLDSYQKSACYVDEDINSDKRETYHRFKTDRIAPPRFLLFHCQRISLLLPGKC